MAYRFLPPALLALIFLAMYFSGLMTGFLLNILAFFFFILTGTICIGLLPDAWKTYGLFLFGVGIVLIVV